MQLEPRKTPNISRITSFADIEELMPPVEDVVGQVGAHAYEFFRGCNQVPFELDAASFSPVNAWYLSELAYLAYADFATTAEVEQAVLPALTRMFGKPPHVKAFLGSAKRWGVRDESDKIQCIVAHDENTGMVAFRGTLPRSLRNWLTDADFMLVAEPGPGDMLVHQGFQGALDSIWQSDPTTGVHLGVEQYLSDIANASSQLRWWFTGHSLGAALATLAARRFQRLHALYTFGSPKVGNDRFVAQLSQAVKTHFRVVNHRDIVTSLPHLSHFQHGGLLTRIAEEVELRPLLERIWAWFRRRFGAEPHVDALMRRYFDEASRLKSNVEERLLLRASLDHLPVFYSKILWNRLSAQ